MTQKGDYDSSVGHFYRAMQIAEQTDDNETRETAKVNFGMANASMKWNEHVLSILGKVQKAEKGITNAEDDEMAEQGANEEEDEIEVPWKKKNRILFSS